MPTREGASFPSLVILRCAFKPRPFCSFLVCPPPQPRFWQAALQPGASNAPFSMPPRATQAVTPRQRGRDGHRPASSPACGGGPGAGRPLAGRPRSGGASCLWETSLRFVFILCAKSSGDGNSRGPYQWLQRVRNPVWPRVFPRLTPF